MPTIIHTTGTSSMNLIPNKKKTNNNKRSNNKTTKTTKKTKKTKKKTEFKPKSITVIK